VSTNKKEDFYVYVLIDPTYDDQPFYVGKGIKDQGGSHLLQNGEDPREKAQRIEKIRSQGQEPYVRRVMWNLDETTAFAVETALINTLPDLLNIIQGQNLSSVRLKRDFPDWVGTYPGVDISMSNEKLDVLDSGNVETCYFLSKKDAYNAAGSAHESVQGSYHIHTECGILMWTGNLLGRDWINQYDSQTGDYFIGLEKLMETHKTWENIITKHNKNTRNKIEKDNKFLCFTQGLSPNNYIKFLGVYEDDWEESRRQHRVVRKRVSTLWKTP
jgi:hypothetical protein